MLYPQDGYWRLRPLAPAGLAPTAFGSSFLIGPVEVEGRPIVKIREVAFDPKARTFTLAFERGGSATVQMARTDQNRHTLEVAFDKADRRPAVRGAALHVRHRLQQRRGPHRRAREGRQGLARGSRSWPSSAPPPPTLWAGRVSPSRHNTSSPDMVFSGFADGRAAGAARQERWRAHQRRCVIAATAGGVPGGANRAAQLVRDRSRRRSSRSSLWMPAAMNRPSTPRPWAAARSVRTASPMARMRARSGVAPRSSPARCTRRGIGRGVRLAGPEHLAAQPLVLGGDASRRTVRRRVPTSTTRSGLAHTNGQLARHASLDQPAIVLHRLGAVVPQAGADDGLGFRKRDTCGRAGARRGHSRARWAQPSACAGSPSRRCGAARCRRRRRWRPRRRGARRSSPARARRRRPGWAHWRRE